MPSFRDSRGNAAKKKGSEPRRDVSPSAKSPPAGKGGGATHLPPIDSKSPHRDASPSPTPTGDSPSPGKRKSKTSSACAWDLPKVGEVSSQLMSIKVRQAVKAKLEAARRSEAEREAFAAHCEMMVQEKKKHMKSKEEVLEIASTNISRCSPERRRVEAAAAGAEHERRVEDARTKKWDSELAFLHHTETLLDEKEKRHENALNIARTRLWEKAIAAAQLPLHLGKVLQAAREKQEAAQELWDQRVRRAPKPHRLAVYIMREQAAITEAASRRPVTILSMTMTIRFFSFCYIAYRRARKRACADQISHYLRTTTKVAVVNKAIKSFLFRVRMCQSLGKKYSTVATQRRKLLRMQWDTIEEEIRQDLVSKLKRLAEEPPPVPIMQPSALVTRSSFGSPEESIMLGGSQLATGKSVVLPPVGGGDSQSPGMAKRMSVSMSPTAGGGAQRKQSLFNKGRSPSLSPQKRSSAFEEARSPGVDAKANEDLSNLSVWRPMLKKKEAEAGESSSPRRKSSVSPSLSRQRKSTSMFGSPSTTSPATAEGDGASPSATSGGEEEEGKPAGRGAGRERKFSIFGGVSFPKKRPSISVLPSHPHGMTGGGFGHKGGDGTGDGASDEENDQNMASTRPTKAVTQTMITRLLNMELPVNDVAAKLGAQFYVLRNRRAGAKPMLAQVMQGYAAQRRTLERAVILSRNQPKTANDAENPSALLRKLKPPALPYIPSLGNAPAMRAQLEELFKESLRRQGFPVFVCNLLEPSPDSEAVLSEFNSTAKKLLEKAAKRKRKALRRMEAIADDSGPPLIFSEDDAEDGSGDRSGPQSLSGTGAFPSSRVSRTGSSLSALSARSSQEEDSADRAASSGLKVLGRSPKHKKGGHH